MDQHELENMTVVALKRELKTRNLPMTGNKNDLVQRLSAASLPITSKGLPGLHANLTGNGNLGHSAHVDVGKILAPPFEVKLTGEAVKSSASQVATAAKQPMEPSKSTLNVQNVPVIVAPQKIGNNEDFHNEKSDVENLTEKSDAQPALTEMERKILRAKKFNVAVVQTKEMRAERFGLTQQGASEKSNTTTGINSEILKKRAERFGIPLTNQATTAAGSTNLTNDPNMAEKLKQRSLRFGLNTPSTIGEEKTPSVNKVTDEKDAQTILKRKERFGSAIASNAGSQDSMEAKKRLRAERFGVKT